jgi:hypothetical protein
LFEPERDQLRLPPEQLAGMFSGLLMMRARTGEGTTKTADLIDVLLHGAVK